MSTTTELESRFLTPEQAAAYLNVSRSWLTRGAGRAEVPARKFGKFVRYAVEDLDQYADDMAEDSPSPITYTYADGRQA